jgi:hypothetical protein
VALLSNFLAMDTRKRIEPYIYIRKKFLRRHLSAQSVAMGGSITQTPEKKP